MNNEEDFLLISESTIPNGGKGLFTLKDIKKGERICQFGGKLIGNKDFSQILKELKKGNYNLEAANYYISLSSGLLLDSYESNCFARYANDAEGFNKIEGLRNNARIVEGDDKISAYLEATEDIPEGSEIFTGYGAAYWKGFKQNENNQKNKK